jgi:putative heme iron utilization protein
MMAEGKTLRLDFPQRVATPAELRTMLVRLSQEARTKTDEHPK